MKKLQVSIINPYDRVNPYDLINFVDSIHIAELINQFNTDCSYHRMDVITELIHNDHTYLVQYDK